MKLKHWALALGVIGLGGLPNSAIAQTTPLTGSQASDSANLQSMVRAGEYGLAQQAATASSDRGLWLQQIAEAQRSQRAYGAALATQQLQHSWTNRGSSPGQNPGRNSGSGGQVQADFDSLIDLIQSTVDPLSWEDAGGVGAIMPYPNGVLIDTAGKLSFQSPKSPNRNLLDTPTDTLALGTESNLKFLSLIALEQELLRLKEAGLPVPPSLRYLGGLYDIHFVMIDADNRDLLLVGSAGPWEENDQGQMVHRKTGKATMLLDDLVVCLRSVMQGRGVLGCSIDPRPGQFDKIVEYMKSHRVTSEKQREALRTTVGPQDTVVFGVPASSHAAHVLLATDYHLKLLAMGHVEAGPDLPSYLELCGPDDPASEVIRWWVTLGEPVIQGNSEESLFQISGDVLELKTENQLLNRQRAKDISVPAQRFVSNFNSQFSDLQLQYPQYGQLENLFELAIAAQVIKTYELNEKIGWTAAFLVGERGGDRFQLQRYQPIREVELVINHHRQKVRQDGRLVTQTVTAISGGVDTKTSSRQIQSLTQTMQDREVPRDLLRSFQQVQQPVATPEGEFRWLRN